MTIGTSETLLDTIELKVTTNKTTWKMDQFIDSLNPVSNRVQDYDFLSEQCSDSLENEKELSPREGQI